MTINALCQENIVGLRIHLFKSQDKITHSRQEVVNQGLCYWDTDMDMTQSGVHKHVEFQVLTELLHVHNE